ncbi:ADP-ribosylglycohydrolase family protein [Desulfocastanea catecholica]
MQEHARSMVLASFAADSLALGAHWIYDTAKIDQQFGRITDLLAPVKGTYHPAKNLGDFTHYGDQGFHLLEHLVAHGGRFDVNEYSRDWQSFMMEYQGYKDKATKETLKNLEDGKGPETCGSQSTDLGGPARIAPLIYCYRDNLNELLAAVTAQTAFTHSGPGVIDGALFLARSCYSILHGAGPRQAFEEALDNNMASLDLDLRLRKCLEAADLDTRRQVKEFGQMCSMNAALPGAVYTVLKNEDSLEEALIETVMAGGDSAARGMVVGMLLGAYHGRDKIPSRWLNKLNRYQEIQTALDKLP